MDEEIDKKLHRLTGKLLNNFSRETPSFDFTTQVMSEVKVLSNKRVTEYRPLISKKIWIVLGVCVIGVFLFLFFGNIQFNNASIPFLKLVSMPKLELFILPDYKISNVFLYGFVGFTIFVGIQILMLKNHFEKQFA